MIDAVLACADPAARNADLVARCLAGDGDAFADIVACYRGRVLGVVRQLLGEPEEVEDVVQDVFCAAYQRLAGLRRPEALGAWLARMAANAAAQRLRRQQVRDRLLDMNPADVLPTYRAHREGPADDLLLCLLDAVRRLPSPVAHTVDLFHLQGRTCRQVGQALGISRSTVKWRLDAARRQLREILEPVVNNEDPWSRS